MPTTQNTVVIITIACIPYTGTIASTLTAVNGAPTNIVLTGLPTLSRCIEFVTGFGGATGITANTNLVGGATFG